MPRLCFLGRNIRSRSLWGTAMRRTLFNRLLCVLLVCFPTALLAQEPSAPSVKRVGIVLDSTKARIRDLLPDLRERAKKVATDKKRNITSVVLIPNGESAVQQAKAASCDYLLQMNVDLVNEVSFGSGVPGPDVNHTGMERAVDGRIVIKYRLQSLQDDNVLVDDRHSIGDQEYPLDPNPSAFQTVVTRAVESATAASMSRLKKKN